MNKLYILPFLSLLFCTELISMEPQAPTHFMQSVQSCGLADQNEINKFLAVVRHQDIDTVSEQTEYTLLSNNGIRIFQKIGSGWRSVIRKPNGRFDISSVGSETVTSRSGFLESLNQKYETALTAPTQKGVFVSSSRVLVAGYTTSAEECKKEKKEKKRKKKEEKHLKKMEKHLRKAQLASRESEAAAAVIARSVLHAIEPENVTASRNDISVAALNGDGAVKGKKYEDLLNSPDAAQNKQKAQHYINSNYKGLEDYLKKQMNSKSIKYTLDHILQNSVFEDNVPSKGNWTLHLDGNQRVVWLGGLNLLVDRQENYL